MMRPTRLNCAYLLLLWTTTCSLVLVSGNPSDVDGVELHKKHLPRVKRQLPPLDEGNQVLDNIFQIPISTLNAVGSLIKSTRPIIRRTRERIQQYYTQQQSPQNGQFGNNRPTVQQGSYYFTGNRRPGNRRPQGRGLSDSDY
ncbi:uncharacterized protein LOC126836498 [Adelges cooleyi]|uniref:uncharacterized protein LOC126836498 n=1 Tax=Adelges cooleyi TaxID=133065 RepID=UPI0021806E54|nr:uncharacterized protein LOC126836498 [Adelges cooleyi]